MKDSDRDGSGSVDFQEFVDLMIKREAEKETPEDLKQALRVFDKVGTVKISFACILILHSGWQWLCVNFRDKVCSLEVGLHLVESCPFIVQPGLVSIFLTMSCLKWSRKLILMEINMSALRNSATFSMKDRDYKRSSFMKRIGTCKETVFNNIWMQD